MQTFDIRVWIALLAISISISACTVGPDYVKPDTAVKLPDAWERSVTEEMNEDVPTLEKWWESLGDTMLTSLIQRAELNSLDLGMAVARVVESQALRGVARGDGMPNLDLDAAYSRTQVSENSASGQISDALGVDSAPQDNFGGGLNVSWEIDLFGRIRRQVESATAEVEASVEDYRDVLVTLYAEIALNYIDTRSFQARILLAESNAEAQRESLGLTTDRYNAGLTSRLDVAQAKSNLANTESQIPPLHVGLAAALNRLAVLLGEQPGSLHQELSVLAPIPTPYDSLTIGLPVDLLRRRPDVRRAERQLAAQTAKVGVATAQLYPSFSLFGSLSLESTSSSDFFSSSSIGWGLMPSVRWNIFQGGKIRSLVRAEEARTQQALLFYERSVLFALEDVENALVSYQQERIRRDRLTDAVSASDTAVQLVRTQYLAGLTNFQNYLDAQRSLFQQQDQQATSEGEVVRALIILNKSLGGGWPYEDSNQETPTDSQSN